MIERVLVWVVEAWRSPSRVPVPRCKPASEVTAIGLVLFAMPSVFPLLFFFALMLFFAVCDLRQSGRWSLFLTTAAGATFAICGWVFFCQLARYVL